MEDMIHPLTALSIAAIVLGILFYIFYPDKGFLARRRHNRKNSERILIEDALKHIYNCEYNNIDCTLHSIAGNLSISGDRTATLIEKLGSLGLIESHPGTIGLTADGGSYALRVIRIHRLWERYLADETGVEEEHWHTQAEMKEHVVSPEEANILSAQLGHPLTDPHGDPIPSSTGEMTRRSGIPIGELKSGTYARIVHIEDEPQVIYSQLVALGLHTGMQIRVIEKKDEKIIIEADGNECVLAPLFANHLHVEPIHQHKEVQHTFLPLSVLTEGEQAHVVAISHKIRGQQRRRLMDLGLVPGTDITAVMKSAGNDPVAYQIRGALIALRKSQTDGIFIQRIEDNANDEAESMR